MSSEKTTGHLLYSNMVREKQNTLIKLGDRYREYMQKVPRMNFVADLIRTRRHSGNEGGADAD